MNVIARIVVGIVGVLALGVGGDAWVAFLTGSGSLAAAYVPGVPLLAVAVGLLTAGVFCLLWALGIWDILNGWGSPAAGW